VVILSKSQIRSENEIVKFIHASDIHLGSHQYRNEERADDFLRTFEQILSLARIHKVDFILLGGDVFTSLEMLPGRLTRIINILQDFKYQTKDQIKIIAIEGNHDIRRFSLGYRFEHREQSWLKLLATLNLIVLLDGDLDASPEKMFLPYNFDKKKGGKIRIKDTIIYGTRYLGENPAEQLIKIREGIERNDGCFHILVQHFGIDGQMENVPGIPYKNIKILKDVIDYLALGHFHLQYIIDNWVFNPGSSEAVCSSDFSFKRGAFLIKITGNREFVFQRLKLENRKAEWKILPLKIPFRDSKVLYDHIIMELSKESVRLTSLNGNAPVLFLVLKGIKPRLSCKINQKELKNHICDKLNFVDVRVYKKFQEYSTTLDSFCY
jgi:DNA repair exonuclease SbcCD nuclease subunit